MSDTRRTAPAIALWEFDSVAEGVFIADAIAKHAPVATITTGTTQPGRYLVLVSGDTASVDVAVDVVSDASPTTLRDHVYLSDIAPAVAEAMVSGPGRPSPRGDAAGIVETTTVAAAIEAADAAAKEADVRVSVLRLADGLGGKGFFIVDGEIGDVSASVAASEEAIGDRVVGTKIITQLTEELRTDLGVSSRFSRTIRKAPRG